MGVTASSQTPDYYQFVEQLGRNEPTLIVKPYLYLGGMNSQSNSLMIDFLGLTHILNMAVELKLDTNYLENRNVIVKHIPAQDSDGYNIRAHFEEAFQFIDDAVAKNGRVLVHCAYGISRSPTIVIAYLMYKYNMSFQDAFRHVQSLRPNINPNPTFRRQLQEFEYELKAMRLQNPYMPQKGTSPDFYNMNYMGMANPMAPNGKFNYGQNNFMGYDSNLYMKSSSIGDLSKFYGGYQNYAPNMYSDVMNGTYHNYEKSMPSLGNQVYFFY